MPPPSPHRAALLSLPALESLKRDQLVKLAKHFDLKANGKVSTHLLLPTADRASVAGPGLGDRPGLEC